MKRLAIYIVTCFGLTTFSQSQLTNYGNLEIYNGAALSVYGNLMNNGTFIDSGLAVTMAGSSVQKIGGTSSTIFRNLNLINPAGVYLTANCAVSKELKIATGTFSTTGYGFTLLSNQFGTARIAPLTGDILGNITMQRYLPPGPTSWRFLATPVSSVTINDWQDDFVTSGFPGSTYPNYGFVSIYTYDETVAGIYDNGFNAPLSANDAIMPGKGYWCYVGPVPLTVDVTGPPAKFTQTFEVSYTASGGAAEDGYVMLGNPYPSAIDWTSAWWSKININNAIYIWNPSNQQFASWIAGVSTNGGSNIISSSQSFWIQSNAANPVLSCREDIKVASAPAFLRPSSSNFEELRLTIEGNLFKDETVLLFGFSATSAYDSQLDARKMFSSNPQVPGISSLDGSSKDMSINALPPVTTTIDVPVKVLVGTSGTYSVKVDTASSIFSEYCLVLEDLVTGTLTNIKTNAGYSFAINDTTKAARFILHVSATGHTQLVNASCSFYSDGKAIALGAGAGPFNFVWSNVSNGILKQSSNKFQADTLTNLPAGIYSVQIASVNGQCGSFTKEFLITEPAPVLAVFSMQRDTIFAGTNDSLVLQNSSSGANNFLWDFGDGSPTIYTSVAPGHHYRTMGRYPVTLFANYGDCSDTLIKMVEVLKENPTGLFEKDIVAGLRVYPNPFDNTFSVSTKVAAPLSIYNEMGIVLYSVMLQSGTTEIDAGSLSKGIYQVKINSTVIKLIKQ